MKTLLGILTLIILAGAGYYFYVLSETAPFQPETRSDAPQGKIDINAVCEGALAYMTFPSGAEAEAWVAECKEGKHPEAIQQWKVQMGITDDRAI